MALKKLALFGREGRRGILDEDAMRGVAWISSPVEKGVVVTEVEYDGEYYDNVSARLLNKNSGVKADAKNKTATVELRVTLEPNCSTFNKLVMLADGDAREAVRQGYAKTIEKELKAAFEGAKEYDCDPYFIKRCLYRFSPDEYDEDLDLDDIRVEYKIKVDIQ